MKSKYFLSSTIAGDTLAAMERYRRIVAQHLDRRSYVEPLPPHITLLRPFSDVSEEALLDYAESMAKQTYATRMSYIGVHQFTDGKYVVIPVSPTLAASALWSGLNELMLTKLPGFAHLETDRDLTPHVTLASDVDPHAFRRGWSSIRLMEIEPSDIVIDELKIWHRPLDKSAPWTVLRSFPLKALPEDLYQKAAS